MRQVTDEERDGSSVAEHVQLTEVLDRRPEELSYGQRRLVAIARAVAAGPSTLLLDKPAAGLDDHQTVEIGHLIRRLADDWGMGVLLIEHDLSMVMRTADRVQVLDSVARSPRAHPQRFRRTRPTQGLHRRIRESGCHPGSD